MNVIHWIGYATTIYVIGLIPMWLRAQSKTWEHGGWIDESCREAIGWPNYLIERFANWILGRQ